MGSCIKLERHSTGVTSFQPSSSSSSLPPLPPFPKIRPNLRSLFIHLIELNRSISPFHFFSDSKFIPGTPNKAYQDLVERRVQEATRQPTLQHRYQINNNNNKRQIRQKWNG